MGQAITGNPGTKWWSSRENPGMRLYGLGMMSEPRGNSPTLSRCGVISMSVRVRRALARVTVRRRSYAAEAEDEVSRSERALECRGNELGVVAEVLAPVEPHSAGRENFGELGKMLVLALAANDLVADDDRPDPHLTPESQHPRSARCAARRGARGRSG